MRPRLLQGMKWQDSTLDTRRLYLEMWNELLNIWNIAASARCYRAMHELKLSFEVEGIVSLNFDSIQ